MGVTLVTGATGFVGSHVARLLVERGDRVRVAVREGAVLDNIAHLPVERATCDVLDRRAVRRAMKDVERVFHAAGTTSLRARPEDLLRINVDATRIVLEEALRAGVERVVHTSAFTALGPAPPGTTADETQGFRPLDPPLVFVTAKHEAENEALRICAQGLPVVVVNPCHCLGAGDNHRSSTDLVRRFLRREIPTYVDGTLNVVDVEDVARGHLLADERGRVGQRYLLGNRNVTFERLFADLGRLSGVEPPAVKLPLKAALALVRSRQALLPGQPAITEDELRTMAQRWAYRSTKAKRELGWRTRHHEDALARTIGWYRDREPQRLARPGTRQPKVLRAAGLGVRTTTAVLSRVGL
jgi:dihydroflavonol-4-reductase